MISKEFFTSKVIKTENTAVKDAKTTMHRIKLYVSNACMIE